MFIFFFFKQKTAYEIKECDWSSDVCSSDLPGGVSRGVFLFFKEKIRQKALQHTSNCTVAIDHCSAVPKARGAKIRVVIKRTNAALYMIIRNKSFLNP